MDPAVIRDVLGKWAQGDHDGALAVVKPIADEGDRAAIAMMCQFSLQRDWTRGVPYAQAAASKGMAWALSPYISNMQADATWRPQIPDIIAAALQEGQVLDPISMAVTAWGQGDPVTAVRMVQAVAIPNPRPEAWDEHRRHRALAAGANLGVAFPDFATLVPVAEASM